MILRRLTRSRFAFGALALVAPSLVALALLLATTPALAQDDGPSLSTSVFGVEDDMWGVDRGPGDHLGHGTAEDLFVELGAGARVSVFSGNLVVSLRTLLRGDVPTDSQLALTYNHLDARGAEALAEGWSYDLGRHWTPGAWGDRLLVDADGFEDSFLDGPLPDRNELLSLADDLVRQWRRQTPLAARRAGGGEAAFRQMIASDPLFFGEMRTRYLGRPDVDRRAAYRSSRRGARVLQLDDGEEHVVLTRHDGGRELYGEDGSLEEVIPLDGPPVRLLREGRLLAEVEVAGVSRYLVESDSYGRIVRIRSGTDAAEIEYADRFLHRLDTPAGRYVMRYDKRGLLVGLEGPEGSLDVEYDPNSGRVVRVRGPSGELRLSDLTQRGAAFEVNLDGSACGGWTATWNPRARERRLESASYSAAVRFEDRRPLPVEWSSPAARVFLEWSPEGRLTSVRRLDEVVLFERSADGDLEAVQDLGGAGARMVRGEQGSLMGWTDPVGRRTRLVLDSLGLPARIESPGGALLRIQRTRAGLLRQLDSAGHGGVILRRDGRGLVRSVSSSSGAVAALRRDALGQVTSFQTPGGLRLDLSYLPGGRVAKLSDTHAEARLRYDAQGTLEGWAAGRDQVDIGRSASGAIEDLRGGAQRGWKIRRDGTGNVRSVTLGDGFEREVRLDADGLPNSWQHAGGGRVILDRDRRGRVSAWRDELLGDASLHLDSWGRALEVRRGSGRWQLERDKSGLVVRVEDPVAASTRILLDPSGHPQQLSAPERLTWHLKHDALGKLTELRDGKQIWTLRHGRLGLPEVFADPKGRELRIDWDSAGRWRALRDGGRSIEAAYGDLGPTRVDSFRRSYGEWGELASWGDTKGDRQWRLERDATGEVVASILEDRSGGARGRALARRSLKRDPSGRLVQLGQWRLSWRRAALRSLQHEDGDVPFVQVERDSIGRATRLSTEAGFTAAVLRDAQGDVREFTLSDSSGDRETFLLSRDSAARVVALQQPSGADLRLLRDPLGRISQWQIRGVHAPFQIEVSPLDGTGPAPDKSLALGLGIAAANLRVESKLSGSRHVEVLLPGRREVLRYDEVRAASGALQAVTKLWESTLGAWEPDLARVGDLIGAQLEVHERQDTDVANSVHPEVIHWGRAPVAIGGQLVAPSVDGTGPSLRGEFGLRLASAGETVTWLSSGALLDGLSVPLPSGGTLAAPSWSVPSPRWNDPDRSLSRQLGTLRGAAAGVSHWWSALSSDAESLAVLPIGVSALSRAWLRPRQDIYSRSALLATEQPLSGAGAVIPPLPGASRLLPRPPGSLSVSPLMALVLAGDIPLRAVEHESWVPMPRPAWTLELPGAQQLLDLAEHRSAPAVPAAWRRADLGGMSSLLAGFVTPQGLERQLRQPYDLRPALEGLPGGVTSVLPGPSHAAAISSASLPTHGRASAIEALSVDPLSENVSQRAQSGSDAMLLFLRAAASRPEAIGSVVPRLGEYEMWRVALPSGSTLVVDGLGRLLSVDGLGRLYRAWAQHAAAEVGTLLLGGQGLAEGLPTLASPRWLPTGTGLPEARWGLLPARLDVPLLSDGRPLFLERVLGSSPFPSSGSRVE